jgi:hypothetical protein
MVETIINLKNNRAKATTATSVVTSEATIRMKKFLGKMGEKNLRSGGEPLRVTLNDIRNVKEKGKWWLVGASWKNDEISLQPEQHEHKEGDELLSLAREQRMNTEIRRAVFIALMGSQVPLSFQSSDCRITWMLRRGYYCFLSRRHRGQRFRVCWFIVAPMKLRIIPFMHWLQNDCVPHRVARKSQGSCESVYNLICGAPFASGERLQMQIGMKSKMISMKAVN